MVDLYIVQASICNPFYRSTIIGRRKSAEKAQEGLSERVGSISRTTIGTVGQRFGSMSRTTMGSRPNGSITPAPQKQSVTNLATRAFNVKKAVSAFKLQVCSWSPNFGPKSRSKIFGNSD